MNRGQERIISFLFATIMTGLSGALIGLWIERGAEEHPYLVGLLVGLVVSQAIYWMFRAVLEGED